MTTTTPSSIAPDDDATFVMRVTDDGVESYWAPGETASRRNRVNTALTALVAEKVPLGSPEALERLRVAGADSDLLVELIGEQPAWEQATPEPIRMADVIDSLRAVLKHKGVKSSPKSSLDTYNKRWAVIEKAFPDVPTERAPVLAFLAHYKGETGRFRLEMQAIFSRLLGVAVEEFGLPKNPLHGVPRPIVRKQSVNVLTLADASLFDATPKDDTERATLDLTLGHGWRQAEARAVTARDDRAIREGWIWCHGKERDEWAPILPETVAVLDRLAAGLPDSARIIRARRPTGGGQDGLSDGGMRQILLTLAKRAGLDHFKGHDTRRTFGTLVTEASGDELLAIRLMRDLVPGVSMRYVVRDLPKLLGRYSPLRLIRGTPVGMDGVDAAGRAAGAPREGAGVSDGTPGETRTPATGSGGRCSIR